MILLTTEFKDQINVSSMWDFLKMNEMKYLTDDLIYNPINTICSY